MQMGWAWTLDELAAAIGAEPGEARGAFGGVSTDTRTIRAGDVFFALRGEHFDGERFVGAAFEKGAAAAVVTQEHAGGACLAVKNPLEALQRFAAYHRGRYSLPLVVVTGSCGKTSAKDFIAAVVGSRCPVVKTQGNLNNEIGAPLSLLQIRPETAFAVIELGANHPGEIAYLCTLARPTEAAITMIAPAHLEGFGSIEAVAAAKAEVVEALPAAGTFYVNADDARCVEIAERFSGEKVTFGQSGDVRLKDCSFDGSGEMALDVEPVGTLRLPLFCRAHAVNVLLAVAVGLRHGVEEFEGPLREASTASARFRLFTAGGIEVIDDTYNANPASMAAALRALVERPGNGARIAAVGEMLELGDAAADLHREVGALAGELGVDVLFARGPHACDTIDAARSCRVPHAEVIEDHHAMAEAVHHIARPGDTLLVKGSRGMRMERVIEALQEIIGSQKADAGSDEPGRQE